MLAKKAIVDISAMQDIADALREKTGTDQPMRISDMLKAVCSFYKYYTFAGEGDNIEQLPEKVNFTKYKCKTVALKGKVSVDEEAIQALAEELRERAGRDTPLRIVDMAGEIDYLHDFTSYKTISTRLSQDIRQVTSFFALNSLAYEANAIAEDTQ